MRYDMFDNLVLIYGDLLAKCLVIAVETIGVVTFIDNFVFPNRNLSLREKCFLELLVCSVCSVLNSDYMPTIVNDLANMLLLGLSLTQMAYDYIVRGIPKFLDKLFHLNKNNSDKE